MIDNAMSKSICRLCLKKDPFMIHIFSKDYDKMFEISIVIATHFAIQVDEVGSFSKHICSDCWNKIKEFHLFYCYVNSQQLTLGERDIEFITLKPELDILENKIKSEMDNTPIGNVAEHNQPQSQTFSDNDNDDHDFDPVKILTSSDDDEEDVLPLSKLVNTKSSEDSKCESELKPQKMRQRKKSNPIFKKSKKIKEGNVRNRYLTPEKHELIKRYFDLKCELCPKIFADSTIVEARNHYKSVHKTEGYLICCDKKFHKIYRVMEHLDSHSNPNVNCNQCTKTFHSKRALTRHTLHKHPPNESLTHKCDECPKTFALKEFLTTHRRCHMKSVEKNIICDVCNKGYSSVSVLNIHKKKIHQNTEVICEICAKIFKNRYTLKAHMKEHEGNPSREQCDICQKWLYSKFSVKYHKERVHTIPTETFKCHICGKIKPNKSALNYHLDFQHGEKTHKCTICVKSFRKYVELQEHIAVHTGVDLYTCTFCPMSFKFKANFYAHRKKMHPQELVKMQISIQEKYAKEKAQLIGSIRNNQTDQ